MGENQYTIDILSALAERTIKRLWILIILLVVLLFGSNAAWIAYEAQFTDEITETYTSEAEDGGTAIVNRDGEVNYGESYLYPDEETNP